MMTKIEGFSIEISSRYSAWWRYNIALMCGCFDKEDNRIGFVSASSHIADVGANLKEPPQNMPQERVLRLETPPCDHIVLYIYIIPHTLPLDTDVSNTKPFDIELRIKRGGEPLHSEIRAINQWSGASIECKM